MSRKKLTVLCIILAGVLTIFLGVATPISMAYAQDNPKIFYVRSYSVVPTVATDKDGLSWDTAFADLQTALEAAKEVLASEEDPVGRVEIWVAAGTYRPTSANGLTATVAEDQNRLKHFRLLNKVAIYGGFPAAGGPWEERNWETNETTLSGNISDSNCVGNCYHVFYNQGLDNTAILDGFTVTASDANSCSSTVAASNENNQDSIHNSGGGFYNSDSSPQIRNVKIIGIHAYMGGGMYNEESNPILINVTFVNNTATDGGGGMANEACSPTLTNVTFSGNAVQNGNGGGMYNYGSQPVLDNVTFSSNQAWRGGGMYNCDNSLTVLDNVTFSCNQAWRGGGMYTCGNSVGNQADWDGVGMYNLESYRTLNNVIFTGNRAEEYGGGVYNGYDWDSSETGEVKVMNGNSTIELTDVIFTNNTAYLGGGMSNLCTNLSLNHVTFTENEAAWGGGMDNYYTNLSLNHVTFTENEGTWGGGGMHIVDSYCHLSNVEFTGNRADMEIGTGGGILTKSNDPEISVLPIEFTDVVFSGNTAGFGGGLGNLNGVLSLNRVEFIANNANCGGAIANNGYLEAKGAKFIGNDATVHENVFGPGGGIWHINGNLNLVNAIFSCNSAYTGGGIFSTGDFNLVNATFSGNHAQIGGGMYCGKTFHEDRANNKMCSVNSSENETGGANVTNCIFWANTAEAGPKISNAGAQEAGHQIYNAGRELEISHSLIQGAFSPGWDEGLGTNGGGNIDADPLFVRNPDPDGEIPYYGDLRLHASSPARDKGTNTPFQAGGIAEGITRDLDGKSRISNARVDMGAYEYQYTPSPPPETPPATPRVERLGGKDRFETAVEISKAGWKQSDTVILARNDVYADALAGVPLAYFHDAPLLLTQTDSLPMITKAEIIRLGAKKVIILGGKDAVSQKVQQKLVAMNLTVERIGASNRFGTAAAIANLVAPNGKEQVALANGYDFPDALSAAAYAANKGMPILLTDRDTLPQETSAAITKLNVEQTIVVGGKEAISEAALAGIGAYLRIAGKDRYGTAIALANHFAPSADHIFIATGLEFADSLTGAALAAKEGCGILLVNQPIPDPVMAFLAGKDVTLFTVFGGRAAVSEEIADQLIQ